MFNLKNGIEVLESTPALLNAFLTPLSEYWTLQNEGEGTWSAFDIVGHLVHGEKTDWISRARQILEHGESRTFEPFNRFAQFADSEGKPIRDLLAEFESLRESNVEILREWNLSDEQLDLRGIHPEFGTVTLRQLLATWVTHDLGHIRQMMRVMAKSYKNDIGPWRAYLPVVNE